LLTDKKYCSTDSLDEAKKSHEELQESKLENEKLLAKFASEKTSMEKAFNCELIFISDFNFNLFVEFNLANIISNLIYFSASNNELKDKIAELSADYEKSLKGQLKINLCNFFFLMSHTPHKKAQAELSKKNISH
jgi:hypothetical protein